MYVITCVCVGVTSEQDILSRAHYKLLSSPEKNVGSWTWWKAHLTKKNIDGEGTRKKSKVIPVFKSLYGVSIKKT